MKLYASYGSNMSKTGMTFRAPTARASGVGTIHGWELSFASWPIIIPVIGGKVKVALWEIDEGAETDLDAYEGYPDYYNKATMKVDVDGAEDRSLALIYLMTPENVSPVNAANPAAIASTTDGYKAFDIPLGPLESAIAKKGNAINLDQYRAAYESVLAAMD